MIPVYAISLVVGLLGLVFVIFGGTLAENLGRAHEDPDRRLGFLGRMSISALVGFGMAGLSAEFAPLDFNSGVAFGIAVIGALAAGLWARYAPESGPEG